MFHVKQMQTLEQLTPQIKALHKSAIERAKEAVNNALRCGVLLSQAREICPHGDWDNYCHETLGLSRVTAWRYIKLAVAYKERGQILEGAKLCDLYREFGLLPPNLGEGNRNPERARQLRDADQMNFHFEVFASSFGELQRYTKTTGHTNPFESLDPETLGQTREQLTKALALVDEALAAN